jgi:hypothetical protein
VDPRAGHLLALQAMRFGDRWPISSEVAGRIPEHTGVLECSVLTPGGGVAVRQGEARRFPDLTRNRNA